MGIETPLGFPSLDIPDDAGAVRGSGDDDLIVKLQAQDAGRVIEGGLVVNGMALGGAVDRRDVTLGVLTLDVQSWGGVGLRAGLGPANHLQAFVSVQVPNADGAIARAGDDLVFIELTAVYTVGVAIEVDSSRVRRPPPALNCLPDLIHQLPVLVGLCGAGANTTHLEWWRFDVDLLFILAVEDNTPHMAGLGGLPPATRHTLANGEGRGIEEREDVLGQFAGESLDEVWQIALAWVIII